MVVGGENRVLDGIRSGTVGGWNSAQLVRLVWPVAPHVAGARLVSVEAETGITERGNCVSRRDRKSTGIGQVSGINDNAQLEWLPNKISGIYVRQTASFVSARCLDCCAVSHRERQRR